MNGNDLFELFPVTVPHITPIVGMLSGALAGDRLNNIMHNTYNVFFNEFTKVHIIQIGAGGTGGYVAAEIMRMIGGLPPVAQQLVYYTLMDGDVFENKNLGRQLCTEDDIGVNKADALVSNYGSYFGCDPTHVQSLPQYLTSIDQLTNLRVGGMLGGHYGITNNDTTRYTNSSEPGMQMVTGYHPALDVLSDQYRNDHIGDKHVLYSSASCEPVVTIIIDCVDKTTPRKLLHDYLESIYTKRSLTEAYESCTPQYRRLDSGLCINPSRGMSINTYSNGKLRESYPSSRDIVRNFMSGDKGTYVITSGNGEFTGQVGWWRYVPTASYGIPIRYDDIFGDNVVSSVLGLTEPSKLSKCYVEDVNYSTYTLDPTDPLFICAKYSAYNSSDHCILSEQNLNMSKFKLMYSLATIIKNDTESNYIRKLRGNQSLSCPVPLDINGNYIEGSACMRSLESYIAASVSTPSIYNRYPELIDLSIDEREDQLSCADRALQNVQNIQTNKTAANLVVNYFKAIFSSLIPIETKPIEPISTASVSFDIRTNSFNSENLTVSYLKKYDSINVAREHKCNII